MKRLFDLKRTAPAVIAALAFFARPASAQPGSPNAAAAQVLFDDALALMTQGKAAEACPKLEKAQRLDPGMATQFRLAECYEKSGRTVSAWLLFVEVADAARAAHRPEREVVARRRAAAIEANLVKMTVSVPDLVAAIPGLEIRRDGAVVDKALWGEAVPVEPGEHTVVATAPGKQRWESKGAPRPSSVRLSMTIPMLQDIAVASSIASPEPPASHRSLAPAFVVGGVGVVGVGVGAAMLAVAAGALSDAKARSATLRAGGQSCDATFTNYAGPASCDALAKKASSVDALHNGGLIPLVVGSAALGGALLYALWPASAAPRATSRLRAQPMLSRSEGGVLVSGSF